jgi:hypothetical protein
VNKAHAIINNAANQSDNQIFTITEGTVDYGYWLLEPPTDYIQPPLDGLPKARPVSTATLPEPAINVTLSRNVTLYLAPLVGVSSPKTMSATATAIVPECYRTTNIPPVAVAWDIVFNNNGGTVQIDVDTQTIKPQSNKGDAGWFNLDNGNSVPSVRIDVPLISGLSGGSSIYLVPGTKATLMDYITANSDITLPVVQDVSQKILTPIITWAGFHVDTVSANSMTGQFIYTCLDPNVTPYAGNGPIGGVAGTPKLVGP